jgi:hypothetical protein
MPTGTSPSWRDKMRQLLQEDLDDLHNQPDSRSIASYDNSSDEVAVIEYTHNYQIGMHDSARSEPR